MNWEEVVAEAALGRGGQDKEDHDRSVHGDEREIKFAAHHAARGSRGKQSAQDRQLASRPAQVQAHQHRHHHSDQHGGQRQQDVLDADHLVIQTEDVLANEALRRFVPVHHVMSCFCHQEFSSYRLLGNAS